MKRLCTICARGGSKGVKNKNITPINNIPLIGYSLMQAKESNLFDHIAVSSDSENILEIAQRFGADTLISRPSNLASDTAAKIPAIFHCVQEVENNTGITFETCVDLDATSPLRIPNDIRNAVDLLESKRLSSVITGAIARRSPYFNLVEKQSNGQVTLSKPLKNAITRRQDAPECYDMNASIYAWDRNTFMANPNIFYNDTQIYVMPEERSIDIDSPLDFKIVEMLLTQFYKAQE